MCKTIMYALVNAIQWGLVREERTAEEMELIKISKKNTKVWQKEFWKLSPIYLNWDIPFDPDEKFATLPRTFPLAAILSRAIQPIHHTFQDDEAEVWLRQWYKYDYATPILH